MLIPRRLRTVAPAKKEGDLILREPKAFAVYPDIIGKFLGSH
jgi:hypothetical protein